MIMIGSVPKMYTRDHIVELLKPVDTDYYGRYEFDDL